MSGAIQVISIYSSSVSSWILLGSESQLFAFDIRNGKEIESEDLSKSKHQNIIRHISISPDGQYACSVGDDKCVKIWETKSWKCLSSRVHSKKMTNAIFGMKDDHCVVIYSDKFGDVFYSYVPQLEEEILLLGHISIITQMVFSPEPNPKYLITADRDERIRVSHYPNAYNIQEFCLGHTKFVSAVAISKKEPELMLSGGGDGTIKLWKLDEGKLLDSYEIKKSSNIEANLVAAIRYSHKHDRFLCLIEKPGCLLVFSIRDSNKLDLEQQIELGDLATFSMDLCDQEGQVWIVGEKPFVQVFEYEAASNCYNKKQLPILESIQKHVDQKSPETYEKEVFPNLTLERFRKKFDDDRNIKKQKREEDDS